jgi:site-specific DNA-cytosine methylase
MLILELFAGSRSFSKVAEERGHSTFTTDIEAFTNIDYVIDILDFDINKVPFVPEVVWCSIPCETYSVASISCHWTGGKGAYIPKTKRAIKGLEIAKKTMTIIEIYKQINPSLIWIIENPRGLLRKLDIIPNKYINTVTYCQYTRGNELPRMKPTDIWTNLKSWKPRKMCKNGDPCHISAPRGSRTGTQGLKSSYERSRIPAQLCLELLKTIEGIG